MLQRIHAQLLAADQRSAMSADIWSYKRLAGGSVQIWRRSDCRRSMALAPGNAILGAGSQYSDQALLAPKVDLHVYEIVTQESLRAACMFKKDELC